MADGNPFPIKHAHSQVELKLSCINLPDLDHLSKTDPQVFLFIKDPQTQQYYQSTHKTEVIMNELDPKFITSFTLDYYFEELQCLRFVVVDVDKHDDPNWQVQELVGYFETDLGTIVSSRGSKVTGKLQRPNHPNEDRGYIVISAEEVSKTKKIVSLQFQAHNVLKKSRIFRSNPEIYFVISRANEDNTFSPVYQSITVASISPFWPVFRINESTLCNGDHDRALEILVKQHKKDSDHQLLAKSTVTLREILAGNRTFQLKSTSNSSSKSEKESTKKATVKDSAYIKVMRFSIDEPPSFLDYIASGTEVNLVVAIDFTESNGDPRDPNSLHYIGGKGENDYQRAIKSVGTILQAYDHDKNFPVLGFGGKFSGILSHAYPLNGNHENPEVDGIDGILATYLQTIYNVQLYGPTNFSPVINQTANIIRRQIDSGKNVYFILLIITDGIITDMDSTVRAIVQASSLPFSIVIVGVGNANFSAMKILDSDDILLEPKLQANGIRAERDIVQFVAMREFQTTTAHHLLPKAVLEEIPDQFMSYMLRNNISPQPRRNQAYELIDIKT
ncbi:hypothetical protein G9A89_004228 [Geosiphon pyriformis]|nr:hypothetical protein G9A89_004228 [Geosiphon pyriformis]